MCLVVMNPLVNWLSLNSVLFLFKKVVLDAGSIEIFLWISLSHVAPPLWHPHYQNQSQAHTLPSKDSDVYFRCKALVFWLCKTGDFYLTWNQNLRLIDSHFSSPSARSGQPTQCFPTQILPAGICSHVSAEVGPGGSSSILSSEVSPPTSLNSIASS